MDFSDMLGLKAELSKQFLPERFRRKASPFPTLSIAAAKAQVSSNIHSIGLGYKEVNGEVTDTMCIRVHVAQKLAPSLLGTSEIQKEYDGIPTDIIESMPAFISNAACTQDRRKKQRPYVAGISAGLDTITAGTLGYFCNSTKKGDNADDVYLLSNNHVFADVNKGKIGQAILQQSPSDGGNASDIVANLSRFIDIKLNMTANQVDAAIAKINGELFKTEICSIGPITGTNTATMNMQVKKHGRTTGYTEGRVTDINFDAVVGMDHQNPSVQALFEDQIRIEVTGGFRSFGEGGDSGSLVVNTDNEAVGLYFAGPPSGFYGIANQIADVEQQLEIKLI